MCLIYGYSPPLPRNIASFDCILPNNLGMASFNVIIFLQHLTSTTRILLLLYQFSHSVVSDSVTPWIAAHQASLSITNSRSPPKRMSIESVMPPSHLILCRPLLLLLPIRVFPNESTLHIRWPKYWSFSFSISPSNEHPGLISFRMDWLDLLAAQGTLNSLPQHHSSKASVFSALSFLHSPPLTSIHDHWKNYSLD